MYLKLSLRNAKRSVVDYLLYIVTMIILLSIMEVSNGIAIMGNVKAGFQTISLPVLITIILIILVGYIDTFMLKQRAKEFANYLLLGMEKRKLSRLFLWEFFFIGIICFVAGGMIGLGICEILTAVILPGGKESNILLSGMSLMQTFLYFCFVQGVCAFRIKRRMDKLEIQELMHEKERNQKMVNNLSYRKWGIILIADLVCLIGLLCGIVFLPEYMGFPIISIIAIPLLCFIFAFYKWFYGYLYAIRKKVSDFLYHDNRLYILAQITSNTKTSAIMNGVFCICLIFSAMAFFVGIIMLQMDIELFDKNTMQWFGFLQISICIIFIVIYFSILSLQQIIELKRETKSIRILHYIGKSDKQVKDLVKKQIAFRLLLPMLVTFFLLAFSIPLLNLKMNLLLPITMHNILLNAAGWFILCFLLFYFCYFFITYTISRQYVETAMWK